MHEALSPELRPPTPEESRITRERVDAWIERTPTRRWVPDAGVADLPEDVLEAFEGMKLAVLRHKALEWAEISLQDLLASLDALKALATAP